MSGGRSLPPLLCSLDFVLLCLCSALAGVNCMTLILPFILSPTPICPEVTNLQKNSPLASSRIHLHAGTLAKLSFNKLILEERRMPEAQTGADFKKELREGHPKMGLFLNAHSPTVAEQLAHSGYDWLLVDTQHGPMGYEKLSAMLSGVASGGAKSLVRVGGYDDRPGIQQALDLGADGVLVPYINTAEEARQAISCTKYPTAGTRSVYFPQRSMNKAGLLGYAGNFNNNGIVALQVETASCIENIAEIAAVPGVDILFLGQNDLCMSMGLYEKYKFPDMYTSPELGAATQKLVDHARKNKVILGLFLFGTARVGEFLEKGFTFISIGNDLHHVLTQAGAYVSDMENIAKEKGKSWKRRPTALF